MMARTSKRGWMKVYEIYGVQEAGAVAGLVWQALAFGVGTQVLWWYFTPWTRKLALTVRIIPFQVWAFLLGFIVGVMALMTLCFVVTAANLLYTNVILRYRMARKMVGMVEDWSKVESVLDVGCGNGLLLNTVALRLKKEGCGGRVVGVDLWLNSKGGKDRTMAGTLRTTTLEGTQEYVTCKSGDARNLPFTDNYFNVVVSAMCLNNLGEELGRTTSAAAEQRRRGLEEIARVMKPGGQAIVWDLSYGPQYVKTLKELGMELVSLSEPVSAYMVQSHIVSFRKPKPKLKPKVSSRFAS
ncbi:unnamed protein product [Calypogeia fissa]